MQERWLEDSAEYWEPELSGSGASGERDEAQRQQYKKYIPFGDGMRGCIGQSLAKMNYTATTALLLSHFTFRLADTVRSLSQPVATHITSATPNHYMDC